MQDSKGVSDPAKQLEIILYRGQFILPSIILSLSI